MPPAEGRAEQLLTAMRYSVLAPGKRLRPVICLASSEAVGGSAESVVDAACALELVHAFSLIHDDLPAIDNDRLRRGRPTNHVEFGEATAVLAGDALFALAFELLAGVNAVPERIVRAIRILALASGSDGLVAGEVVDVISEGKPFDHATLEYIHSRKTGALIAASCEIGALLGGGDAATVDALRDYGSHLGLAFQIADDILNETATAEDLGKAAGSDRTRGKATYPALHGLEGAREAAKLSADRAIAALPDSIANREFLVGLAAFTIQRKT